MAKRIRVVTAQDVQASQALKPRVVSSDNPRPTRRLTANEIRVRKFATTSSFGFNSRIGQDVLDSAGGQFYSPQLSTDFLEKPQNLRERRAFYRYFYNTNEIVGAAVDTHSTLPLSKLRLVPPKGKNRHQNEYVFKFFERMCEQMKLFKTLIEITHEYTLFGNAMVYAEDDDSQDRMPPEEKARKTEQAKQRSEFLKKKFDVVDKDPLYTGWKKLIILPPDQVRVRKLPLTDNVAVEFVPDPETKRFITSEMPIYPGQYEESKNFKYEIPADIQEKVKQSGVIPLDTDPYTGSHVFHLARKKSQYEPYGQSIIERCVNTLVLLDKLRQAQTSIASRHMTPMRIVWAEDLNPDDVDNLREQVDMALVDPDYSVIANYEIHWDEMGSQGRLLDIEGENEAGMNRLFAGLGVTREILTGEGTYTGSKISLEIMNTQYLLYREIIQDYVENNLFRPVAIKKGFIEYDDYGNEIVLYPRLSFTRLAIRDNEQFFDAAFQLYQKGSLSIDLILDILNIDPASTREKLEHDLFTVNDSQFNEVLRNLYTNVSTALVENTDFTAKMAEYLGLKMAEKAQAAEGASRFSSSKENVPAVDKERVEKLLKVAKYLKDNPLILDRIFDRAKVTLDGKV